MPREAKTKPKKKAATKKKANITSNYKKPKGGTWADKLASKIVGKKKK